MASRDHASNPFWWVVLGFICGAVATLGALILYGGDRTLDARPSQPAVAIPLEPEPARKPAPRAAPEPPPLAPASPDPAPASAVEPSPAPAPAVDSQIADDAAATGMTARSPRN